MAKTLKGVFTPNNPKKYKGNSNNIIYRSSYELNAFKYLDSSPNILEWVSEEVKIRYFDVSTKKMRTYYVDLLFKTPEYTYLCEIKPKTQFFKPKRSKRLTEKSKSSYNKALETWAKNLSKWDSAIKYCKKKGLKWIVMTKTSSYIYDFEAEKYVENKTTFC